MFVKLKYSYYKFVGTFTHTLCSIQINSKKEFIKQVKIRFQNINCIYLPNFRIWAHFLYKKNSLFSVLTINNAWKISNHFCSLRHLCANIQKYRLSKVSAWKPLCKNGSKTNMTYPSIIWSHYDLIKSWRCRFCVKISRTWNVLCPHIKIKWLLPKVLTLILCMSIKNISSFFVLNIRNLCELKYNRNRSLTIYQTGQHEVRCRLKDHFILSIYNITIWF